MDDELDRFKRIDLPQYAADRGYRVVGREQTRGGGWRGSTPSSLLMRHPTTDDKIVLRLDGDGHWTYFSVRDGNDNGTIIDFLQRRGCLTIVIATDNDDAGEKLAAKIADLAGTATVVRDPSPVGKDWNDCLQEREEDYIRSLRSRNRGPER